MTELTGKKVNYSRRVVGDSSIGWVNDYGQAEFIQFGVDYEEFENGACEFTTAILLLDNGTVIQVRPENIQFIK